MNLMFKFACTFAVFGFILSLIFGLLGGVRLSSVIFTSLVSTFISGGLGAGVQQILQQKVPESLELFQLSPIDLKADSLADEGSIGTGLIDPNDGIEKGEEDPSALLSGLPSEDSGVGESSPPAPGAEGAYGSHIMIDKIKIKNEPKLLADAVRTMIMRDDEGTST